MYVKATMTQTKKSSNWRHIVPLNYPIPVYVIISRSTTEMSHDYESLHTHVVLRFSYEFGEVELNKFEH